MIKFLPKDFTVSVSPVQFSIWIFLISRTIQRFSGYYHSTLPNLSNFTGNRRFGESDFVHPELDLFLKRSTDERSYSTASSNVLFVVVLFIKRVISISS
jgi:hypothetical protein